MKHYFLGLAANYSRKERLTHTFAVGREIDRSALRRFLTKKYDGETILTKNGRSALALAFKAYFGPGDAIIVNGFTCYAVYEAVKAAGLTPIWADISKENLNFDEKTLKMTLNNAAPKGIVIQNSLGNPVDIVAVERFAKKHNLIIIEDLAHSVGVKYPDGREVGTVGSATALSFGKEKSIDTISGGAVILHHPYKNDIEAPSKFPKISDTLRARFYPLFGAIAQGLSYVHLSGVWMRILTKIHWVEKSADNKLDLDRKIAKFEAKLALKQLKNIKKSGEKPLREFYLVRNRNEVLKKLRKNGYFFGGLWYERPVSPKRYYKKVHFPEEKCPVATEVAGKIINFPTYYNKEELAGAREIIKEYLEEKK
jgi:perosamine synthetase